MDYSKISIEQILSIADELNVSAGKMQDILMNIQALFAQIGTDGVWSGTASAQTKETFNKLSERFPDFYETIKSYSTYLRKMVENYQAINGMISD